MVEENKTILLKLFFACEVALLRTWWRWLDLHKKEVGEVAETEKIMWNADFWLTTTVNLVVIDNIEIGMVAKLQTMSSLFKVTIHNY